MSGDSLTISVEPDAQSSSSPGRVTAILEDANRAVHHERGRRHFCATLRGPDGAIEGGINAQAFWGWLYISDMAIEPRWRGHGYGRKLIETAEAWGAANDCQNAWLMTMSFQARGFYERVGYSVFAELGDYPPGESRLFLRKPLA